MVASMSQLKVLITLAASTEVPDDGTPQVLGWVQEGTSPRHAAAGTAAAACDGSAA